VSSISLFAGDNRQSLRQLIDKGVRVHSVVTDPPYGLVSVQKRFGKENAAPARSDGNDGSFARLSGGFMGKQWDATGIERDPEFWRLIWEILLPGGYVFAFSGSRTGHWQACAMEMAGFIMHPMHGWCFGSGFPKAHAADKAIGKAIDKALGAAGGKGAVRGASGSKRNSMAGDYTGGEYHDYLAATPEAQQWEGWAYGTQTQKPALEPIYLGQKPFSEKTGAANILKHGVGAVNIDGCRVPTQDNLNGGAYAINATGRTEMWGEDAGNSWRRGGAGEFSQPEGRHPSNLILDGSPEVVTMFPCGKSGKPGVRRKDHETHSMGGTLACTGETEVGYGDEGSAARFFHQFAPDEYEEIDITWTSDAKNHQARLLVVTGQLPVKVIAASGSVESSEWNTFLFGNGITALSLMDTKSNGPARDPGVWEAPAPPRPRLGGGRGHR
jgi:site-specific DNA-methyltransferase (adenine-specific)